MRVTVFTSNQARHVSLIDSLADHADEVFAVQECNTLFPGEVSDFFRKSEIMQTYFRKVLDAEHKVFGYPRFHRKNVRTLSLKMHDLNRLDADQLRPALNSDAYVVFGATYIKGWLCEFLTRNRACNIHMGTSPYYRGSSCNFWALSHGRPDYVGATIHLLSQGLDSGAMLFHALPEAQVVDGFELGMLAVRAAHKGITNALFSGEIFNMQPVPQDRGREISYTRNVDFTDQVAAEYLAQMLCPVEINTRLKNRNPDLFLKPYIG